MRKRLDSFELFFFSFRIKAEMLGTDFLCHRMKTLTFVYLSFPFSYLRFYLCFSISSQRYHGPKQADIQLLKLSYKLQMVNQKKIKSLIQTNYIYQSYGIHVFLFFFFDKGIHVFLRLSYSKKIYARRQYTTYIRHLDIKYFHVKFSSACENVYFSNISQ